MLNGGHRRPGCPNYWIPLAGQLVEDVSILEATGLSSRPRLRLARWNLDHHDLVSGVGSPGSSSYTTNMPPARAEDPGRACSQRARRALKLEDASVFTVFRQLADVRKQPGTPWYAGSA